MNIKVCGITDLNQLRELDAMDIDFVGLNFYKGSSRYVADKMSGEQIKNGDFDIKKIGVFVNESIEKIMTVVEDYGLDIVQLHGDESSTLCGQLSREIEVIKAFRLNDGAKSIEQMIEHYDDACDYYLFDAGGYSSPFESEKGGAFGGTGKQFNWDLLNSNRIEKPFFLAGGIGLPDAVKVKNFDHPDFFAVDINSRFEISPGVKDLDMVRMFARVLMD